MIFPRTIAVSFSAAAIIFTTSSGDEVPKATIVSPITILGILNFFARFEAPSTSLFAPKINAIKPPVRNKNVQHN